MSTVAPSGDISEGKALSYDQIVKQLGSLESRLDGIMSIIKEVNVKLEQQELSRKRSALLSQRIALKRASDAKSEEDEVAKKAKKEEDEAKRKKLEELKSRLQEVKSKVEEAKKAREASAKAPEVTGKGNVGAVKEETSPLAGMGASAEFPDYWKEITGASSRFKELGLLSG
jgi:septal ring factor EnvC (AmiA/AmiB activator)